MSATDGVFTLGIDASLSIYDANNALVDLGANELESIKLDPIHEQVEIKPLTNGGRRKRRRLRNGWKGSLSFARVDGKLDAIEQFQEDLFQQQGKQTYYTINVGVKNQIDGSSNEYRFPLADLALTSGGEYVMDQATKQTLEFDSPQRITLS